MKPVHQWRPVLFIALSILLQGTISSTDVNASDPALETLEDNGIFIQKEESIAKEHEAVQNAVQFFLSQRKPSYGWEKETHRALTVLSLAGTLSPEGQRTTEEKLMVKELELRLALDLAKQHQEEFTAGQLALYVNALLGVCSNPRDFYGLNLVAKLRSRDEIPSSYSYALQALALCNAGVGYEKARILKLIEFIKESPSDHGGISDSLSMTIMALACGLKYHSMPPIERYLNRAVQKLKRTQNADGSFGNVYSSGLALQALILADTDEKHWNISLAREYLLSQQREDGSFVDFMGTYFAVPPLLNRTFGSFANWSCDESESTTDSNSEHTVTPTSDINRTEIAIGIRIRADEIQGYRVDLKGYQSDSLYSMLILNRESVSIEFKDTSYGHMIVGVDGLNQDPTRNKYWTIYMVDKDGKETPATSGVDGIFPEDGDSFVLELKTFS